MALILSIDTSTPTCAVALHQEGKLLAAEDLHVDKSHSGYLVPMIRDLLSHAGYTQENLEAVALGQGPGSYTGLRIGASTAKGLCYALDIPLIAVDSLLAMAAAVAPYNPYKAWLCPMIDARRMEVYCLLANHTLEIQTHTTPHIVEANSFAEALNQHPILFFGDGAAKCEPVIGAHSNAHFIHGIGTSAKGVGHLAWQKYQQEEFEDVAYFTPNYLKEWQAKAPKKLV